MSNENETQTTPTKRIITDFEKARLNRETASRFFSDNPSQMTLDALIESGLPVFVRNNTTGGGRVAVDFDDHGRKRTVTIPNTSFPIELTAILAPDVVGASGHLRDDIRKKALLLVHPVVANDEFNTERGQRELAKIQSALARETGSAVSSFAVETKPVISGQEVSGRMENFVVDYLKATDPVGRLDVLDKIFANERVFKMVDVDYLASKLIAGDDQGPDTVKDLRTKIKMRQ